jgi:hypothetical protein
MLRFALVSSPRVIFLIIALLLPFLSSAEGMPFSDIPPGAWYESAVELFLNEGYLDPAQPRFRGSEKALRAEFVKLIIELNGGILTDTPAQSSFSDVSPGDWFFPYFEEAAREGWVKGDGECLGTRACGVRPRAAMTRAEAAALIRRAFGKKPLGVSPAFKDNPLGSWFTDAVQTAADHCILRGDDASRNVRPGDALNRAEMIMMLSRVDKNKRYPGC